MRLRDDNTNSMKLRALYGAAMLCASPGPALAASQQLLSFDPFVGFLTAVSISVFAWAFVTIRRMNRNLLKSRSRLGELEYRLNEAEAAIASEAQVLIVWQGKSLEPQRIVNSMHGALRVPDDAKALLTFASWLEPDSAAMLASHLEVLRERGKPFNLGLRTAGNELLEADGRVAGGMATLRFRPLAGERQQVNELAYDARKLGLQVERLSAVLDSAPLPVWLRDGEGKLTWVNQAYVKAMELTGSDQVLKAGLEIAPPERIDTSRSDDKQALLGRAHTVQAGTMRALNIHEVQLAQGKAGFAIDVSSLEQTEKELERLIKAHASTLDKLDTAIAIFGPDQRLRFHNSAYAQLWPLDPQWLSLKPTDSEILDRLRSQRCIPEQANYREWKAKQLSAYTTLEVRETWWYLPDGRSLHVVCEQHPFGGVTYLYQNVTKTLQLESRYNEMIDVQRETLDNLEEAVALFGSDGRLKLFNPAFQLYWQFEGAFLMQEPHIDQLAKANRMTSEAGSIWQDLKFGITGLESERRAVRGRLKAGERILQYSMAPLLDGNSLLTFTDISDPAKIEQALRERAEALEAADRLKNTFLGNISYEIRTPLTSILGFAETLTLGLVGELSHKQLEYVQDIKRSSEDLKSIIDAIIDLSAIDAGAMELKLANADVIHILEAAAERVADELSRRDQTLSIELAEDSMQFVADAERVEQVVRNLLSNAIGFSPRGTTIRLGARRAGDKLQIWVADTGSGIDPEFQKKAFDRFQAKSNPGSHRGPGLGLAIVKSFTELHGGQVMLVSKPSMGTTVVCNFPVAGPGNRQVTGIDASGSPQRAA
jgi:signal transduction histidine kinase